MTKQPPDQPAADTNDSSESSAEVGNAESAIVSQPSTVNSTPLMKSASDSDSPLLMALDLSHDKKSRIPRRSSSSSINMDDLSFFDLLNPQILSTEIRKLPTYQRVKNISSESIRKLNKKGLKFNLNQEDMKNLKSVLNNRLDKLYVRIDKTITASKTEKLYYATSVYMIFLFGLVIGKHPEWFHWVYTLMFVILMPIRFITYYKMNWGYYLADLCYYVNGLLMLFIWVFPDSKLLYVSCLSFSYGTLSFAVITWKNKLVLHSIDKTTSTFIHVVPPTVMYVITHQIPSEFRQQRFAGAMKLKSWEIWNGILYTSAMYFVWQSLYHYFITVKRADKIKNGKITSFEHLRKAFAKKPVGKFVNSLPEPFPVFAFMALQYLYQLGTMSVCPLVFKYKYVASIYLSFIFFMASYNGATYYIDFYGKKLQKEVERLQSEINELQTRAREHESEDYSPVAVPNTS
ncbi:hypothetical protein OGAPHI_001069 [Ogataea philodendri]|uniref:Glycerophosphocholine acyltransferase 1 n=1 Tax=Ogataea philodendri TaxID=1378263 RepID=A0A9P8PFK9_9ASCO|nr:uncharacterized protein OGAPHI_001069 [Ogataea philodendri]KAH3670554.1 hypothetical protein OGAPHI_001069 [Ogataea philodendri]